MDGRQTDGHVRGEAHHPLHAQQVGGTVILRSTHPGRHGVGERVVGSRVDADLGRQLGVCHQRHHGPLASARRSSTSGMAAITSAAER